MFALVFGTADRAYIFAVQQDLMFLPGILAPDDRNIDQTLGDLHVNIPALVRDDVGIYMGILFSVSGQHIRQLVEGIVDGYSCI